MGYQQQPQDSRAYAFAVAANGFFTAIDVHIRNECARLQSRPSLSDTDLTALSAGLEAQRQTAYQGFLADVRTKAHVASAVVDRDPELKAVFGNETVSYTRQALAANRELLDLRVLRFATLEEGQRPTLIGLWKVLGSYVNTHNARHPRAQVHTPLNPRGQTYEAHFQQSHPETDHYLKIILPPLDKEMKTRVPQNAVIEDILQKHPKSAYVLAAEIAKKLDGIVISDAANAKRRLDRIREEAFARVAKSRRATLILKVPTEAMEDLLRKSSSAGDE